MLTAGALLISLSVLSVLEASPVVDDIDHEDNLSKDPPPPVFKTDPGLSKILNYFNACDPNPCSSGGSCQSKLLAEEYTCACPEPYEGPRCQFVRNICESVTCGQGDCVINMNKDPFYECICQFPYYGPDCKSLPQSPCELSPCHNGGSCTQGNHFLQCDCPDGYTGKFCEIAPTDCYEGNGETYRGVVSETEEGKECLDWHSSFILQQGEDPYNTYSDFDGLQKNHCRNPDGDGKPWCFYKRQGTLQWDYCNIKRCREDNQTSSVSSGPDSSSFSKCGISDPTRRVFGSSKAVPGAHPWQASVQARPKGSDLVFNHICGGILLSSCWVLTAAHCIKAAAEYQVVLGRVNLIKQEAGQTIPVIQTIVHENYRDAEVPHNDIALLHLRVMDHPYCAKENRFVRTVCLPDQTFTAGKECVISGWGATKTNEYSPQLLNARMIPITNEECNSSEVYRNKIDRSMLCAGNLQGCIRTGKGDSGGPMVCKKNGTHFVTGVVSWGDDYDCAFSVFANVYHFNSWIESKINRTFHK